MAGKAKIDDVAKLAGVSVSSVSRAMNPKRYASEALREKVMAAIRQLDYEPNASAQNLRAKSSKSIGCMVSDIANPMYAEIICAAEKTLYDAGYLLIVASTQYGQRESEVLQMLCRRGVDGVIGTIDRLDHGGYVTPEFIAQTPFVLLDRDFPDLACDRVLVSHDQGAYDAIHYLLGLGHRKILIETSSQQMRPGRLRIEGALRAVADYGLPEEVLLVHAQAHQTAQSIYNNVLHELASPTPPTAIVVLGAQMLEGALAAIDARHWKIPQDISVFSFGDTALAHFAAFGLSAVRWDLAAVGRTAAQMILERLESSQPAAREVVLPTEIVLRRSCLPPPERLQRP